MAEDWEDAGDWGDAEDAEDLGDSELVGVGVLAAGFDEERPLREDVAEGG